VADNEEKTLAEFNLHDNCTLFLELSKEASSKKITIRAVAVVGNDTTIVKVNPNKPGKRSSEIALEVSPVTSVRDLRDRLGCLFYNLSPGWTHVSPSLPSGATTVTSAGQSTNADSTKPSYRLCKTTLLDESESLLFEVGAKGEDLTLEAVGITSDSLLLLEEGEVPVKGLLSFSLFLWSQVPFKSVEMMSDNMSESMCKESATVASAATTTPASITTAGVIVDTKDIDGAPIIGVTQVQARMPESVPVPGPVIDSVRPEEILTVERTCGQHLLPLGDVACHEDKLVSDLQNLVFKAVAEMSQEKRVVAFPDGKYLVILRYMCTPIIYYC